MWSLTCHVSNAVKKSLPSVLVVFPYMMKCSESPELILLAMIGSSMLIVHALRSSLSMSVGKFFIMLLLTGFLGPPEKLEKSFLNSCRDI